MAISINEDGCKNPTGAGYEIWSAETESGPTGPEGLPGGDCSGFFAPPAEPYACNSSRCATEEADTIDHVLTLSPGFYTVTFEAASNVRCTCFVPEEFDPEHASYPYYDQYSEAIFTFSVTGPGIEMVEECAV